MTAGSLPAPAKPLPPPPPPPPPPAPTAVTGVGLAVDLSVLLRFQSAIEGQTATMSAVAGSVQDLAGAIGGGEASFDTTAHWQSASSSISQISDAANGVAQSLPGMAQALGTVVTNYVSAESQIEGQFQAGLANLEANQPVVKVQ